MNSRQRIIIHPQHGDPVDCFTDDASLPLSELLASFGFPLNTRCGCRGLCRGCEVQLIEGSVLLGGQLTHAPTIIRACQARAASAIRIGLPDRSRIGHQPQVSETFEISVPYAHDPLFAATASHDTAFAIDIGTTTVAVLLVDIATGTILARAGGFNGQIRFGDNVLTRIDAARTPEAITAMQHAVVRETLAPLLTEACQSAGRNPNRIAGGTIAGNTTMLHLLLGIDPTSLGIAPFTATFLSGKQVSAGTIGLEVKNLLETTPIQLLPSIGAYIGADISAGMYATGMIYHDKPCLLVDIGTNGEIVLQHRGQLTACATAAGPAFEGCGLRHGTRAREGAISDLTLSLEPFAVTAKTIANTPLHRATGICGSAYIDFLASARACQLISTTGRFTTAAWQGIPQNHRILDDDVRMFNLSGDGHATSAGISEVDIALLMQAKAAIGAGIETLLETAEIRAADIYQIFLAGGFGMHLNVANAIAIGLLPQFRPDQIRVVGNTSLAGALLAVIDRTTLDELEAIRTKTHVIELNRCAGFEDRFIEHLMLP